MADGGVGTTGLASTSVDTPPLRYILRGLNLSSLVIEKGSAMSRLVWLIIAFALLLFPGCGLSRQKMDANAAKRIHTIALLDVAVTKDRTYFDPAGQFTSGLLLGDVGALGYQVAVAVPQSQ